MASFTNSPSKAKTQRSAMFSRRSPSSSPPSFTGAGSGGGSGTGAGASTHIQGPDSLKLPASSDAMVSGAMGASSAADQAGSGLSQNFPTSENIPGVSSAASSYAPVSTKGDKKGHATTGGLIDVNKQTAAILELTFSVLAFGSFMTLWIYLLVIDCRNSKWNAILLKFFSVCGCTVSLFALFHSCFDRRLTIGRGIMGCIVFFIINIVIFMNLVGAFWAINCACNCHSTQNAFQAFGNTDLVIFWLELISSLFLIVVLIVSSVVHK